MKTPRENGADEGPANVADRASEFVFSVDAQGLLTWVSATVHPLLGYQPAEVIGTPYAAYVCPDEAARANGVWRRVMAAQVVRGARSRLRHRDGRDVSVLIDGFPLFDAAGRFLGGHGAVRDVTACRPLLAQQHGVMEQVGGFRELGQAATCAGDLAQVLQASAQAFESARQSEARFRDLVEKLPCVAYIIRPTIPADFVFITSNVEHFTGYTPEDFYADGTLAYKTAHPEDRDRVIREVQRGTMRPEPYAVDYRTIHRNGKDVTYASVHSTPVLDAEGRVVLRHGIIMDVTEQKRLEHELLQSQRLAAIGEMAAMMAHEIRNPLAGMSLAVRVLRHEPADPAAARECLDDLDLCLQRINTTVSRVLGFSKARPLQFRPCSLADIVRAAGRLTATYIRKNGVQLETDLPPGLPKLVADPDKVEEVFVNLILNSCKAMPHGGRLTIRAQASDHSLCAEVADTGIGIEPERLGDIFTPFYSGFSEGTGLGLALCQRIVAAHGGTIRVASTPGQGTTFRIELPLEPPDATRPPR